MTARQQGKKGVLTVQHWKRGMAFMLSAAVMFGTVFANTGVSVFAEGADTDERMSVWVKTDPQDITPEDQIAITVTTSDGTIYILPSETIDAVTAPEAVAAEVSGDTLTTEGVSDSYGWTLTAADEDGWYIGSAEENYLNMGGEENGLRISEEQMIWVWEDNELYSSDHQNRIGVDEAQEIWYAQSVSSDETSAQTVDFWKYSGEAAASEEADAQNEEAAVETPEVVYSQADATVTFSSTVSDATYWYSYDNESFSELEGDTLDVSSHVGEILYYYAQKDSAVSETASLELAAPEEDGISTASLDEGDTGLWITEIFPNDYDTYNNNTYGTKDDRFEFVELTNITSEAISFNDQYNLLYGSTQAKAAEDEVTTLDGSSDITIEAGETVVIWNYRETLTSNPTIDEFRAYYMIDSDIKVLVTHHNGGWANNGYFALTNAAGTVVCEYTYTNGTIDTADGKDLADGLGVDLGIPVYGSAMYATRQKSYASPGYVYSEQTNGLSTAATESGVTTLEGLYITESHPNDVTRDSAYGSGTNDMMEYIEVTNTTGHDIDFNTDSAGYTLYYLNKTSKTETLVCTIEDAHRLANGEVTSSELSEKSGVTIAAGQTVVFWCYREGMTTYETFPTEEEFRAAYSIDDATPVYAMVRNGVGNTDRGFAIAKTGSSGWDVMESYYYWGDDGSEVADGKSADLSVSKEGPRMTVYQKLQSANAGTVAAAQITFAEDDGSSVSLTLNDGMPESIDQGEDLRVYFTYAVTGNLSCTDISTHYRLDGEGSWYTSDQSTYSRVPNLFESLISADVLFSHEYVEFYVTASNSYRTTYTEIYTVKINRINDVDGVRLNIEDGEAVSGTVSVTANDGSDNADTKIYLDDEELTTTPMMEDGAYFSFLANGRDSYFKNAVTTTDNEIIAYIGYWQRAILDGQVLHIDNSYFTYNEETDSYDVTLRMWAGTWGTPAFGETLLPEFNQDDWTVSELILKLANGNEYLPTVIGPDDSETSSKTNLSTEYDAVHKIGDSSGMSSYLDVSFSVPADEVTAVGAEIDTTQLSEGEHTLKATSGDSVTEVTFVVDNTAPVVSLGVEEGSELGGTLTFDPSVSDNAEISEFLVLLDGEEIETPYETTAAKLGEGDHVFSAYAEDTAGNVTTAYVNFTVSNSAITLTDAGSTNVTDSSADAYLTLESSSDMDVTFYEAAEIETSQIETTTTSGILPYITYTIEVGEAEDGDTIMASWDGTASNADDTHATTMYVLNTETGNWDKIGTADAEGSITNAKFTAADHVADGKATIIVQCTVDSALPSLDTTTSGLTGEDDPNADWDGYSVPEDYDFSIAWQTDTQYYAEQYYDHWITMNNWIVDNADELNIEYVIHTGDIVDDYDMIYEWDNADDAMAILDDAGIEYGVLGGNHDVAAGLGDNENYYNYFSEDRVSDQTVYGDSYEDNLGHYDLLTAGGQDFIILYMSWNIYQEELDWMNEVLAKYSDRMAILCFHTYTRVATSSNNYLNYLDYTGNLVQQYVVAQNPNVFMVLNGHYHGSSYAVDTFDDDGDGEADRMVYEICTDYQSGFEGGSGYLKMLYFDLDNSKIYINSYSASFNDFNYYDSEVIELGAQTADGTWETQVDPLILDMEFDTTEQSILENSFSAYLCTDQEIGTAKVSGDGSDTVSGTAVASMNELAANTTYGWYAVVTNEDGNTLTTGVYTFTTECISVDVPEADATVFTYNGSPQTYAIADSDYYMAAGNVQTDAGTYTVTVMLKDPDSMVWADGSTDAKTYVFIINRAQQQMSYEQQEISKTTADEAFVNELTQIAVAGEVTYASSDESVATVDESGKVMILGTGTAVITATAAETANYLESSASYVLTVNASDTGSDDQGSGSAGGSEDQDSTSTVDSGSGNTVSTSTSGSGSAASSGSSSSSVKTGDAQTPIWYLMLFAVGVFGIAGTVTVRKKRKMR